MFASSPDLVAICSKPPVAVSLRVVEPVTGVGVGPHQAQGKPVQVEGGTTARQHTQRWWRLLLVPLPLPFTCSIL